MRVLVSYEKQTFDVNIDLDGSVLQFKQQLYALTRVAPANQKIVGFKGGLLKDSQVLRTLNIKDGQKIMLLGPREDDKLPTTTPTESDARSTAISKGKTKQNSATEEARAPTVGQAVIDESSELAQAGFYRPRSFHAPSTQDDDIELVSPRRRHHVGSSSVFLQGLQFSDLPEELQIEIFDYLSEPELAVASAVSREWRRLANDPSIWRRLFHRRWPGGGVALGRRYRQLLAATSRQWKLVYLDKHRIETNWRCANTDVVQLGADYNTRIRMTLRAYERGHGLGRTLGNAVSLSGEVRCLQYDAAETVLVAGVSANRWAARDTPHRVHVYAMEPSRREFIKKLVGHKAAITALQHTQHILITGSEDGLLLLWDLSKLPAPLPWSMYSNELIGTLRAHAVGPVASLQFDDQFVVSGGGDGVCIFDLASSRRVTTLASDPPTAVSALRYDAEKIIVGFVDGTVRIADNRTGRFVGVLRGHTSAITRTKLDPTAEYSGRPQPGVFSSSLDGSVRRWDVRRPEKWLAILAAGTPVNDFQTDLAKLVVASPTGVLLAELSAADMARTGESAFTRLSSSPTYSLQFSDARLITGVDNEIEEYTFDKPVNREMLAIATAASARRAHGHDNVLARVAALHPGPMEDDYEGDPMEE